jgi:hemolysin D
MSVDDRFLRDCAFEPIDCTRRLVDDTYPWAGRLTAMAALLSLAVAALWACIAEVDMVVTARGVIIPAGGTKTIQSNQDGTVLAIHVVDGQSVRAGATLIVLDPTTDLAEGRRIENDLRSLHLDIERLEAMLADDRGSAAELQAEATSAERDLQTSRLRTELERHRHRLAEIDSELRRAALAENATAEQQRKLSAEATFRQARAAEHEQIVREGLLPRHTGDDERHAAEQAARDMRIKQLEQLALQEDRARLRQQREQEIAQYRSAIYSALDEARRAEGRLREAQSKARIRYRNSRIVAPVDGVVQELIVHTVGGVVTTAQPLMTIVPSSGRLQVNAWVANRDAGYVHSGQTAELRIDAFDYARFGVWPGKVVNVSDDVVSERRADGAQGVVLFNPESASSRTESADSHYLAHIDFEAPPPGGRESVPLKPGMTVEAGIVVGRRRVIEYFLAPVVASLHRPFSDR